MSFLSPIHEAPVDGSYIRIVGPQGGYVLAHWADDAWRFANGAALDFEPTHFLATEETVA